MGIGTALLIEVVLLLLLLSLGRQGRPGGEPDVTVVNLQAHEASSDTPEQAEENPPQESAEAEQRPEVSQPDPAPVTPAQVVPLPMPTPAAEIPIARAPVAPPPPPPPAPARPAARINPDRVYGPPNTGGARGSGDSERVGTAPNGQPLYAARWYREPSDGELRGYLSTATGPGWGLIACRTAPDYRVEDCVPLDEYPQGSMLNRAILAAAWQFKVRPPRLGGRDLVGEWVRIRIDYREARRQ